MKKPASRESPAASAAKGTAPAPAFTPLTAILGGAGLVSIVSGFVLLSTGSITLAPVLLVLGYVVLVPLAILR
jgi:hypothetical protein